MRSPAWSASLRRPTLQRQAGLVIALCLAACDASPVAYPAGACTPVGEFGTQGRARIQGTIRILPVDRPLSGIRVSAIPSLDRRPYVSNGMAPTLSRAGDYSMTLTRWSLDSLGGPDTMTARLYWYGWDSAAIFGLDSADVLVRFAQEGQVPSPSRFDITIGP